MKIKDFKKTQLFEIANIVEYMDQDGNEIDNITNTLWRKLQSKEIIDIKSRISNNLIIVTLYINI